jgi:3-phenylpropionate/trans-cinnamate dioxygenase ferredoxin reductase subunit
VTRVVVVGAGLAGGTVVGRLRALGHAGPIALVGAEAHLPYERPALSKGYLTGATTLDRLLVHPQQTYDDLGVELRLGSPATGLDVERRVVQLGADELPYDVLVVATGSTNVRPPIPGMDLTGVHQLRTAEDADRLREHAANATTAVVVGTGFIGCEVSATLRSLGLEVTAVDALPGPIWAVLGEPLSGRVRGWHEAHGVRVLGGAGVAALEGGGWVEQVRLVDGTVLPADLVVVGVGARPELGWLEAAPLERASGGLLVDAGGRTSAQGVFAAGDLAAVDGVRAEHYSAALAQADRVAHAVLGLPVPAIEPTWFWSDQYEHTLQYAGRHGPEDQLVERAEPYTGFFLREGALTAVVTVDNGRDLRRGMKLLGRAVDPALLADPARDLRTVA